MAGTPCNWAWVNWVAMSASLSNVMQTVSRPLEARDQSVRVGAVGKERRSASFSPCQSEGGAPGFPSVAQRQREGDRRTMALGHSLEAFQAWVIFLDTVTQLWYRAVVFGHRR